MRRSMWWAAADPPFFVSVVQKPERPEVLCVRGRREIDLVRFRERLAAAHEPPLSATEAQRTYPTIAGAGTDYGWRLWAPHEIVAEVARRSVMGLSYRNFKCAVGRQDRTLARYLGRVWGVLYGLEGLAENAAAPQHDLPARHAEAAEPGLRLEPGMTGWIGRGTVRVTVVDMDSDDCAACTNTDGIIHYVHRKPGQGWLDGSDFPFVPDLSDRATRLLLGG